jgi:hypothetical protein
MHAPHATMNCLSEIPQFFFALRYARCMLRTRFVLAACSIHVLFEIWQLFTCVCSTFHDMRAARAAHSRIALAAAAPPCSIHILSRFALVLPLRACAGRLRRHTCALRAMRTPTPITCADSPMSVCTNLGLDQSSRLGANAGYVVLCACK